jgi:hypothetical protein
MRPITAICIAAAIVIPLILVYSHLTGSSHAENFISIMLIFFALYPGMVAGMLVDHWGLGATTSLCVAAVVNIAAYSFFLLACARFWRKVFGK